METAAKHVLREEVEKDTFPAEQSQAASLVEEHIKLHYPLNNIQPLNFHVAGQQEGV